MCHQQDGGTGCHFVRRVFSRVPLIQKKNLNKFKRKRREKDKLKKLANYRKWYNNANSTETVYTIF